MKSGKSEEKAALRARARAVREQVDVNQARAARDAVAKALIEVIDWSKARLLLAYAPVRGEVDPSGVVEAFWGRGLSVAFPTVDPAGKRLVPKRVLSFAELVPGAYGIPSPPASSPEVAAWEIDVVLVPGLAFDRRGYRLGYGGGYYDRFLPLLRPGALKVGLAYARLLWEELPAEEHDQAVDWVVTEEGIHRCRAV